MLVTQYTFIHLCIFICFVVIFKETMFRTHIKIYFFLHPDLENRLDTTAIRMRSKPETVQAWAD
jgi:hypothetical protein